MDNFVDPHKVIAFSNFSSAQNESETENRKNHETKKEEETKKSKVSLILLHVNHPFFILDL
jgi:hypothetical protein